MKRFHVHVGVSNLEKSTQFYSAMFGMQPTVKKDDYAKWMLEDPRVNFAISQRGGKPGINHLGFQADNEAELEEIHARLQSADTAIVAEEGANCCYAKSDKYWVQDPSGLAWESFRSLDTIPFFGDDQSPDAIAAKPATTCCPTPAALKAAAAPIKKGCCNA
jgi:catechol 2,3-dioxygenase-like lactoylglutathione lyase family enzyme